MSSNDPDDDVQPSPALLSFRATLAGLGLKSGTQKGCTSPIAAVSDVFSTPESPPPSSTTTPRRLTRSTSRLDRIANTSAGSESVNALATRVETASLQSPSPSPRKRNREASTGSPSKKMRTGDAPPGKGAPPRKDAPPSENVELKPLTDRLQPDLDVVFCGINPGIISSKVGAHYGNKQNHFWGALYESGFTSRFISKPAEEEHKLPAEFSLGLTDIVERPTNGSADLSKSEFQQGVPGLLGKLANYRPRIVCFVGKEVWQRVEDAIRDWSCTGATDSTLTVVDPPVLPIDSELPVLPGVPETSPTKRKKAKAKKPAKVPFKLGLQPYKLVHPPGPPHITQCLESSIDLGSKTDSAAKETLFFVMVSTSSIVSQYSREDKVKMMKDLRFTLAKLKSGALDAEVARFRSLILTTTTDTAVVS